MAQDKTGEPVTEGNSPLSVVIASHNRESVMFACKELLDHNISFQCGVVYFGQLYGMLLALDRYQSTPSPLHFQLIIDFE